MTDWREHRDHAAAVHSAALASQQAAESAQARQFIADFLRAARDLPTTSLRAFAYGGRARYRTGLRGWYLNQARTIAIDVDGNYYVLGVPRSFAARFTGTRLQPQEPRLIIGQGGRDGESMPLQELLRRVLATIPGDR